jgi:hypothetical protein
MSDKLTNVPRRDLDELYPKHSFMTIFNPANGEERLVGTIKSISGRALYHEIIVRDEMEIGIAAKIIAEHLDKAYTKDRWTGKGYIEAYYTSREWDKINLEKRSKEAKRVYDETL